MAVGALNKIFGLIFVVAFLLAALFWIVFLAGLSGKRFCSNCLLLLERARLQGFCCCWLPCACPSRVKASSHHALDTVQVWRTNVRAMGVVA